METRCTRTTQERLGHGIFWLILLTVVALASHTTLHASILAPTTAPMAHCNRQLTDQMDMPALAGRITTQWHYGPYGPGTLGAGVTVASDFMVGTFGTLSDGGDEAAVTALNLDGTVRWTSGELLGAEAWKGAALIDSSDNVYAADERTAIRFGHDGAIHWSVPHPGGSSPISFNMTDEGHLIAAGQSGPWGSGRVCGHQSYRTARRQPTLPRSPTEPNRLWVQECLIVGLSWDRTTRTLSIPRHGCPIAWEQMRM